MWRQQSAGRFRRRLARVRICGLSGPSALWRFVSVTVVFSVFYGFNVAWLAGNTVRNQADSADRSRQGPHRPERGLARGGVADDLEDVVLVPMDDDGGLDLEALVEERKPEEAPPPEAPAGKPLPPPTRRSMARKPPPALPAAAGPAAAAGAAPAGGSVKAKPKRWLAGRGNAKRRKLEENSKLQAWLKASGVWVSDKADWGVESSCVSMAIETREVGENEISGRGLIASRDINIYEEIAKVPLKLLMTRDSARAKFGEDCIPGSMSEYTAIALQLVSERFQEQDSFWDPYLAVLPQSLEEIGSAFAWSEEELESLLAGSPLQSMSLFLKGTLVSEFEALQQGIFARQPGTFTPEIFTFENFLWAYGILFSRSVKMQFDKSPAFIALVPYIDLINHSPNSECYIKGHSEGIVLPFGMSQTDNFAIVTADKYYNKYDQVYISYGPKSNAQLLMIYGFCLERNLKDFIEIPLFQLLDNAPFADAKRRWLAAQGLNQTEFPLYRERFTDEMRRFLRVVVLQPEDINCQDTSDEAAVDAALSRMDFSKPSSELLERRALLCLKGVCEEVLSGYPTTLEQDEALIQDRTMFELLPKNQRNALRVRYGEKVILQATMNTLDRIMNNLGRFTEINTEQSRMNKAAQGTFWGRLGFRKAPPAFKATSVEELMKELDI